MGNTNTQIINSEPEPEETKEEYITNIINQEYQEKYIINQEKYIINQTTGKYNINQEYQEKYIINQEKGKYNINQAKDIQLINPPNSSESSDSSVSSVSSESYKKSYSISSSSLIINTNLNNTRQVLYDSPLSYINQEYNQESRKRQFSTSLYETRKFKLFNKYGTDYRNILCIYKILDKYYNLDYKLLNEDDKKNIHEYILNFRTSSKFIDKYIYKNICDYNFQYLGYFYYYLGKALKILNETVNNTYNSDVIEEAKNTFIEYLHYLENRLEDQHNKKIWTR